MLRTHKTKIIATIGPASKDPAMLIRLIEAGMDIARLNFSHGDFSIHEENIANLREAEKVCGKRIAIMADLPGPKMRIGEFSEKAITLSAGDPFVLTTDPIAGDDSRVSMSFEKLPEVVKAGNHLLLNDGTVELIVEHVDGAEVHCRVLAGGELSNHKGLNLPNIPLGIQAFTDHDRACLEFALEHGVDAVSQSFVESEEDIFALRQAAADMGKNPFVIAKIERSDALVHIEKILDAADGIMIARGDLGVEVPIERIALLQKELIARANAQGKPVITATQMLESMIHSRMPTRAEATDVANAILDGADAIMLSGESAVGHYPEESVAMLAKIAADAEAHRPAVSISQLRKRHPAPLADDLLEGIADIVDESLDKIPCAALFIPTRTGATARRVSRGKPPVWIIATCSNSAVAQGLLFSYGVHPLLVSSCHDIDRIFIQSFLSENHLRGNLVLRVDRPLLKNEKRSYRIEFIPVG